VLLVAAIAIAVLMIGGAASQERPSGAKILERADRGPSGQPGPVNILGNPAKPYTGGAVEHGPYRLLPPGTKYIPREYPKDAPQEQPVVTLDASVRAGSSLYIAPLPGFTEVRGSATLHAGEVVLTEAEWSGPVGTVYVAARLLKPWNLPLDVYLSYPDSALQVRVETISGYPAVILEPARGPAPNVGYVQAAVDGELIHLSSPTTGQDTLRTLAAQIIEERKSR